MRCKHPLFRFVAVLLLAWILGDIVGTGVCPGDVDPCAGPAAKGSSRAGLPHGQHSGMATIHVGHCLCHGLVTLSHVVILLTTLEPLRAAADPSVSQTTPGVPLPVYHPPQLAA